MEGLALGLFCNILGNEIGMAPNGESWQAYSMPPLACGWFELLGFPLTWAAFAVAISEGVIPYGEPPGDSEVWQN